MKIYISMFDFAIMWAMTDKELPMVGDYVRMHAGLGNKDIVLHTDEEGLDKAKKIHFIKASIKATLPIDVKVVKRVWANPDTVFLYVETKSELDEMMAGK